MAQVSELSTIPILGRPKYRKNNWINKGVFLDISMYPFTMAVNTGILKIFTRLHSRPITTDSKIPKNAMVSVKTAALA